MYRQWIENTWTHNYKEVADIACNEPQQGHVGKRFRTHQGRIWLSNWEMTTKEMAIDPEMVPRTNKYRIRNYGRISNYESGTKVAESGTKTVRISNYERTESGTKKRESVTMTPESATTIPESATKY